MYDENKTTCKYIVSVLTSYLFIWYRIVASIHFMQYIKSWPIRKEMFKSIKVLPNPINFAIF